jgi:hypothetical protein
VGATRPAAKSNRGGRARSPAGRGAGRGSSSAGFSLPPVQM